MNFTRILKIVNNFSSTLCGLHILCKWFQTLSCSWSFGKSFASTMLFDYDFNEKYYFLGNKPHDRAGADQPFVNSTRVNILCEYFIFTQLGWIFLTHLMEQKMFDRVNWNLSNRTEHNQWMHGWLASIFRIQTDVSRLMLLEQTQMRTSQEKTHLSYRYLCHCQLSKMWRELAKKEREHTFHTIGFVKIILMLENVFDCMGNKTL